MLERHKKLLRPLVAELRKVLAGSNDEQGNWQRGDLDRELERIGFGPDGTITPLDVLSSPTLEESRAYAVADTQLTGLKGEARKIARAELVERAAYTWINRLLALRAMEARGLVDETLRSNPEYDKLSEALFVLRQTSPARTMGADGGWWTVLEDACNTQKEALPGLFDLKDPNAALRPSTPALLICIRVVGGLRAGFSLEECDATFADPDAIGWAYQFYQEAAKARVYAKLGSGGKAGTRAEIAAATQLFTEPYMVQWLLQNSLGRSYHELYPESRLPESWPYYIKPETPESSPGAAGLATLTVMDPCAGSGHFLREAFDMLVAMYREQFPGLKAAQIADNILERHLHGIDLDPRAAQLAVLTLYLRAWELVRDERKKERKPGPISYRPPRIKLASTPSGIGPGALERHLRRHPQDRLLKPVLEGIFASLEQADILGSLLRPREYLDKAITALQGNYTIPMDEDPADAQLRQSIIETAKRDPIGLRKMLLDRIASTFQEEAGQLDDVATALFGREVVEGVLLLQLLEQKYAVVVTNPPYMGSKNMDNPLRKFVEQHYKSGKRDLYAAFILRCLELCSQNGRVAMVTQQSWMFLQSFTELRALPEKKLSETLQKGGFTGLLREVCIEEVAHLGERAFEEAAAAGAFASMFVIQNQKPEPDQRIIAFRLMGLKSPEEKKANLLTNNFKQVRLQSGFITIAESRIAYWIDDVILYAFQHYPTLSEFGLVLAGLKTASNDLLVRCFWETTNNNRWKLYAKGGGYKRWAGQLWLSVKWHENLEVYRELVSARFPHYEWYGVGGFSFSNTTRGLLGLRNIPKHTIFGNSGPIVLPNATTPFLPALLNSHLYNYFARCLTSSVYIAVEQVAALPVLKVEDSDAKNLMNCQNFCVTASSLIAEQDIIEANYSYNSLNFNYVNILAVYSCICEGMIESTVLRVGKFPANVVSDILRDTGTPASFYPLLNNYDSLPELPSLINLPNCLPEVTQFPELIQRAFANQEGLTRIKANLRTLYEAGPGAKNVEQEEADSSEENEEAEETVSGAHIPIPTETFLEELSVKLQIHPISVYWLLEELRAEGVRCKPEELRLLEDRLSVLVLR
ncbi:MAG: N-6 DNA methylase, partial [Chloroflexota bacterium]